MLNFSNEFLDELGQQAAQSLRGRQHRNLHAHYDEPCQRMFNAVEVDSYIPPHRHSDASKPECLIVVRGLMTLVTFDAHGGIIDALELGPGGAGGIGAELPPGIWHTVLAESAGAVLFEVKPGPFDPAEAKELAPWAPAEGSPAAEQYLVELRKHIATWRRADSANIGECQK